MEWAKTRASYELPTPKLRRGMREETVEEEDSMAGASMPLNLEPATAPSCKRRCLEQKQVHYIALSLCARTRSRALLQPTHPFVSTQMFCVILPAVLLLWLLLHSHTVSPPPP
jgi:hypothetical protein